MIKVVDDTDNKIYLPDLMKDLVQKKEILHIYLIQDGTWVNQVNSRLHWENIVK